MATSRVLVDAAGAAVAGLIDLLMPPACMACGGRVATPLSYCADCWAALPANGGPRCARCAVPLPAKWQAEASCLGCLNDPPAYDRAAAPFLYDGPARQVVLKLKRGREAYAVPMAAAMHRAAPGLLSAETLVVPVPLHPARLFDRGFNQALLLARALVAAGEGRLLVATLRRVKATPRSRGMTRAQRARNVEGAFRVRGRDRAGLKGRQVLLVDDVMTSGATASACARVLKRAGAAAVDVLVFARVATTDVTPYLASPEGLETHGQDRDLHEVPLPLLHAREIAAEGEGRGLRGV
jgi:ComF family protein